jgi:hypothetical protein
VSEKLIASHLVEGEMKPGAEIGLRVDQTLTQDATGTLVMLELESMGLDRVRVEVAAQYLDHNLLQEDSRNPDDHVFLRSACRRFGIWYSRPGTGVSHPVHQERFGRPGKSLLGSDSHTPAAGSMGMLAIGAGGLEVAMAMAGRPFHARMPRIWGVRLVGHLPEWVSAKGRHPRAPAPSRGRRRDRQDRRVPRLRARRALGDGPPRHRTGESRRLGVRHDLSERQAEILLAGGLANSIRATLRSEAGAVNG